MKTALQMLVEHVLEEDDSPIVKMHQVAADMLKAARMKGDLTPYADKLTSLSTEMAYGDENIGDDERPFNIMGNLGIMVRKLVKACLFAIRHGDAAAVERFAKELVNQLAPITKRSMQY